MLQLIRNLDGSHNALTGQEGYAQGGAGLPGGCGPCLHVGDVIEAHGLAAVDDLPHSALQCQALFGSAGHERLSAPSVVGELPGAGVQQDHAGAGHPQALLDLFHGGRENLVQALGRDHDAGDIVDCKQAACLPLPLGQQIGQLLFCPPDLARQGIQEPVVRRLGGAAGLTPT